jgi:hypothetical protein
VRHWGKQNTRRRPAAPSNLFVLDRLERAGKKLKVRAVLVDLDTLAVVLDFCARAVGALLHRRLTQRRADWGARGPNVASKYPPITAASAPQTT